MHMLKCAIGTGILFLPHAFRRTGYVMSFTCGLIVSLLCTHTAILIVKCSQMLCRRKRVPMLDFAETARSAFQTGPEWIRKYAEPFGVITNVIICFVHFQAAVIYILYVATRSSRISIPSQVIEFFSDFEMNPRVYIIFFPFTGALGFAPSLKCLVPFSVIGSLFLIVGVCIACYYFLAVVPDPGRLDAFTQILPVPMYCAIFLFAPHNMTLYLPLENTMKHPTHMPRLIVANMVVKIAISLSVLFSFGLAYYVPISVLWPIARSKIAAKSSLYHRLAEISLRLGGVTGTTLLAIAVPQMVPLLGLFSAFGMSTIMLLIPILIETSTKWTEATRTMLVKNAVIFVVWLLILVRLSFQALEKNSGFEFEIISA
ncbi:Proton-coupled amino acid transporter [Ooceraea biroi]|uniref:Proton-coupled amino acid transporter n=1 Tax=Ooceraea biroi TaxID=2015173 RepID=A0A026WZ97_OOCBI|nr:Proton-coupled amino acid transporter [Ooceraea biroi]